MNDLYPYQKDGVAFLAARDRALLGDEPGLGKTRQAIAAVETRVAMKEAERKNPFVAMCQVICPASAVPVWYKEIEENARRPWMWRVTSFNKIDSLPNEKRVALVIDEGHALKNPEAQRTRQVFGEDCTSGLVGLTPIVYSLSGTPTPNDPSEIWTTARALFPEALMLDGRPMNHEQFRNRYTRTRMTKYGWKVEGAKNVGELRERLSPYVIRRLAKDVLDLPPMRFVTLPLAARSPEGGDDVTNLRKAFAAGGLDAVRALEPQMASWRRNCGLLKVPAAIEWLKDWFTSGGKKIVVFAQHTDVIDALYRAFPDAVGIDGRTIDRQTPVTRFQTDSSVGMFIGQLTAAGEAITLTAASDMLFLEMEWNPKGNIQPAKRIHRIGQKNHCLVRFASVAGSIDDLIAEAVVRKLRMTRDLWD